MFFIFPLIYRLCQSNSSLDTDLYFRKIVLTRLDTIGFGLLASYIKFYYNDFWKKSKNVFFILGLALLLLLINIDFHDIFYKQTYYLSLIGLFISLLLPKLESFKNENIPFKPFQFISKISYSMYLIHIPAFHIISNKIVASNKIEAVLIYLMFWIVVVSLSVLIHNFYEEPIMKLGEKFSLFKKKK